MAVKAKSSRLFENNFLEAMTHVHPIIPLVFWSPLIAYLLWSTYGVVSIAGYAAWFVVGVLSWTFAEYIVHRYVFHYQPTGKISSYIVYLFHGIHHDEPDDWTRLVMPILPAILISGSFFLLFIALVGFTHAKLWYAFFMVGYLGYDYIHYATHHFACKDRFLKMVKRHHMLHHHLMHRGNFGVSSPLWDHVFRTYYDRVKKESL